MIKSILLFQGLLRVLDGEVLPLVDNPFEVSVYLFNFVTFVGIISSATKCSIGFVIFGLVMDYVIDSFQEQAAWTEHIKLPKTVI